MANLKREFLHSDVSKYLPVQLTRSVSALADVNPDIDEELTPQNTKRLTIFFPERASVSAFLVRLGDVEEIVDVSISVPGTRRVDFNLSVGEEYNIYVVSKEYEDGYISTDKMIIPDDGTNRWTIVVNQNSQFEDVNMDAEGRMTLSVNEDQWYNYDGTYNSDQLLWEYPENIDALGDVNANEMIYRREVLTYVKRLFDANSLDEFTLNNKQDILNSFYIMTTLAKFMREYRESIDETTDGELTEYWDFFDENIYNGYLGVPLDLHESLSEYGTLSDYLKFDGEGWTNNDENPEGLYEDTRNRIENPNANPANILYRPMFDQDNEAYGALEGYVYLTSVELIDVEDWTRPNIAGRAIFQYSRPKLISMEEYLLQLGLPRHNRTEIGTSQWWSELGGISEDFYDNVYNYVTEELNNVNQSIEDLGNLIFVPENYTGGTYPLAHEATLQNIRFLRHMLEAINDNVWISVNHINSIVISELMEATSLIREQGVTYNITNTTKSTNIGVPSVRYTKLDSPQWNSLPTELISLDDGIVVLNLNTAQFSNAGKYAISISPQNLNVGYEIINGLVRVREDLNQQAQRSENYFVGWNIQFTDLEGNNLGDSRVIVGSMFNANEQNLKVSPSLRGVEPIGRAIIWSSSFEPVLIDLDIVEHNNLTLSYSMYARREFNRDTGLVTLYDYNGNVYKRLSYGQTANEENAGQIIDYRDPTPTTDGNG